MQTLTMGLLLAQYTRLRAVAFAVLAFVHPGAEKFQDTPAIVDAIVWGVLDDASPVWNDETEVGVAIVFADRESRMQLAPKPWIDPRTHKAADSEAHGAFQEHARAGLGDADDQVAEWLRLLHDGARACPSSPAAPLSGRCGGAARRLADYRVRLAQEAIRSMTGASADEMATDDPEGRE